MQTNIVKNVLNLEPGAGVDDAASLAAKQAKDRELLTVILVDISHIIQRTFFNKTKNYSKLYLDQPQI